ncbi:DEAD/DEAH box helicase [Nitrincola sp.]|uniref:preprotein translocase subunit SecA n=1 Tax=Nitrincola sp. TaxID=1926584 RepID=UPI003A92D6DE
MYALQTRTVQYPQRTDWHEDPLLVRFWDRGATLFRRLILMNEARQKAFVRAVSKCEMELQGATSEVLQQALCDVRLHLRREGLQQRHLAQAFALVRVASQQTLGLRHHDVQIRGGHALVQGFLIEMNTGEGKTLTATLAAAVAALSGRQVQVVTVNDYLAQRDATEMQPLYEWLGLRIAWVLEQAGPAERRQAYQADIVYCTGKTLTFDYLKDRIALDDRVSPLKMLLDAYTGRWQQQVLLPGLQFAIVDEVDSILIDEARTPLIISSSGGSAEEDAFYVSAIEFAQQLRQAEHFQFSENRQLIDLTLAGRHLLEQLTAEAEGLWCNRFRREEAILQALSALHRFQRDIHYIVRDDKVLIVDEHTGRIMPDRSWEKGMQQLIEVKESVSLTPPRVTLAKISFQLFFRRFLQLSGMSGTCREIAGEISRVYNLRMIRIPPHKPSQRVQHANQLFADVEQKWLAVEACIIECQQRGQPVLVGTRSILAADTLSSRLQSRGVEHQLLHARQDETEAEIVAQAGQRGRVTIATNMAGRGTDIKLQAGVAELGGLHVLITELHDNQRIDRQLIGRCARQGEPGSWQEILSLEDELVANWLPVLNRLLSLLLRSAPENRAIQWMARRYYRSAQWMLERLHRRIRAKLLKAEFNLRRSLSFTGKME